MIRIVAVSILALGLLTALTAAVALHAEYGGGTPPLGATAAAAQECMSEALPVQAPAPPQTVAADLVRLPATGNAGLLPDTSEVPALQECPTPAAEPTVTPPGSAPSATPAPVPTATASAPGVELPGGGGTGDGGLDFPPGTISY